MNGPTRTGSRSRLLATGAAALAVLALATASPPAQARGWVSVGAPFPGYYYGAAPYYGYPSPYYYAPPDYYAPPAGSYAPPSGYYAPLQGGYPSPPGPAPSAYTPPAAYPPPAAETPSPAGTAPSATAAPGAPGITYTNKPAFTNAAGQTCREYKTTNAAAGRSVDVYGTACKTADGQWRVVN